MSVPVRYSSAAAEYAAEVDCELESTLQQQQQQQQLHLQQQYEYEQYQHYQYQREQDIAYYCQLQAARQQEQLMQQRTSMSSLVMPGLALPQDHPATINPGSGHSPAHNNNGLTMDAHSINDILVDDEQPSTSAQAAAAAAAGSAVGSVSVAAGSSGSGMSGGATSGGKLANGINRNAEMPTDWMRIADEGRYGTPGAAGLEYQKYEKQQQLEDLKSEAAGGAVGGANNNGEPSSSSKKLEDQLHALTSDELYETLKEYDALQDKFHTVLLLPKESRVSDCRRTRWIRLRTALPEDVVRAALRRPVFGHEPGGPLSGSHGRKAEAHGLHERGLVPSGHQAVGLEAHSRRGSGYNISVWLYRWRSGTHGRRDCQQAGRPDGTCTDHFRELPAHLLRPVPQLGEGDWWRLLQVLPATDQAGGAGEPPGDPDVRREDHGDHAVDAGAGAYLPAPGLPHQGVLHSRQSGAEARLRVHSVPAAVHEDSRSRFHLRLQHRVGHSLPLQRAEQGALQAAACLEVVQSHAARPAPDQPLLLRPAHH
ncbi:cyclin G isoform X2 [Drosophila gunungcola]|uniref:cyclin G isoform X2 n=1 Tax=Drosophila gunungcola TaxID=103775 RepID=UPI0022E20C24|nr:cyclin G isoform X2 [Drosophila gunungcola]